MALSWALSTNQTEDGLSDPSDSSNDSSFSNSFETYISNPDEMLQPWRINPHFTQIVTTHAVTFIVGVLGNGLVLGGMSRDRKGPSATKLFLMSLAVADLLLLLVCVPLEALKYFLQRWQGHEALCKLSSFAEMLSPVASVLNLTAVSLERFVVIVFPMRSRALCTLSNCRRALLVVWVVSLILTTPSLITKELYSWTYYNNLTRLTVYYCNDKDDEGAWAFAVYSLLVLFVVPAILMTLCYARVIKALWMSTVAVQTLTHTRTHARMSSSCSASTLDSRTSSMQITYMTDQSERGRARTDEVMRARKQVIKMLILVVFLFLACWGPRVIMEVLLKLQLLGFSQTVYSLRIGFYLLPFIHSCVNPVVYCAMSTKSRRCLRRHWRRLRRRADVRAKGHRRLPLRRSIASATFTSSIYSPTSEYSQRPTETESLAAILTPNTGSDWAANDHIMKSDQSEHCEPSDVSSGCHHDMNTTQWVGLDDIKREEVII